MIKLAFKNLSGAWFVMQFRKRRATSDRNCRFDNAA